MNLKEILMSAAESQADKVKEDNKLDLELFKTTRKQ